VDRPRITESAGSLGDRRSDLAAVPEIRAGLSGRPRAVCRTIRLGPRTSGALGAPAIHGTDRRYPADEAHPSKNALHLLWTIPVAVLASLPLLFFSMIALCGVSGCGGGGFGPAYGPDAEWIVPLVVVGVLLTGAIGLVPWASPKVRWITGALVGLAVAAALIVAMYTSKYPTIPPR
jgi:hypothetical protein